MAGGTASYFDGNGLIENRNGSDRTLRRYVWGAQYVDELVLIGIDKDPQDTQESQCEMFYWVCQPIPGTSY